MLTTGCARPAAATEIAAFEHSANEVRGAYLAPNTTRSYLTGKRAFLRFMLKYGYAPILPASDRHIALFIIFTVSINKNLVSTAKQYLFGVRALHLEHGMLWQPWSDRFLVYQALRGCKRLFGEIEGSRALKLEMTMAILLEICQTVFAPANLLNLTRANKLTLFAVCLVAFFGLLRKDNVAISKAQSFNPNRCLRRADFSFAQNVMVLKLRWSKVIQFSDRFHTIPYRKTGNALCPVEATRRCFQATPDAAADGPAFVWENKAGRFAPLTHATFVYNVKRAVQLTGRDPQRYSGISFRRGGASAAAALGANHELIKELGDWKSDAYLRYLRRPAAERLALPTLLANAAARATLG